MDLSQFSNVSIAFESGAVAGILYGVYLVIAGMSLVLLRKKRNNLVLSYTIVQLTLTTLYFAIWLWVLPSEIAGAFGIPGPNGAYNFTLWPVILMNTALILNTWISDAFLLYRCYVISMGSKYALAVPVLLYLSTIGASIALLVNLEGMQLFSICYWSLSAALNVCASCVISVRLLMHRRTMCQVLGSQRGAFYLNYTTMTLESAFLYTVFAILASVIYTLNSALQLLILPVFGIIQSISPTLIVYRIARGIAFQTDEYGSISVGTMRFASTVVRTVQQDTADSSGTMFTTLGDRARKGRADINDEV